MVMEERNRPEFSSTRLTGSMFLYERPELLTAEEHGDLGLTPAERPHDYLRDAKAIPLTMVEFASAQRHYPIVFSNLENPVPLAVVSVLDSENLFVGDNGRWDDMAYLPSYIRCHPFTVTGQSEEKLAVVVDRAAASVTEDPEFPFFVDGQPSEHTTNLMNFCGQYETERRKTQRFCEHLKSLDLLTSYRSTHRPPGADEAVPLADYHSVNVEKLNELPEATVFELHKTGQLVQIYMQVYSIENFRHLVARRELGRNRSN